MAKELVELESTLGEQASADYFRSQREVIHELAAMAGRAGTGDAAGALAQFHARVLRNSMGLLAGGDRFRDPA
jgi:hypothetical protein